MTTPCRNHRPKVSSYLNGTVFRNICPLCGEEHYTHGTNEFTATRVYFEWELKREIDKAVAAQAAQVADLVAKLQAARAEIARLQELVFEK